MSVPEDQTVYCERGWCSLKCVTYSLFSTSYLCLCTLSPALCAKRRARRGQCSDCNSITRRVSRRTRDKAKLISPIYLRVTDARHRRRSESVANILVGRRTELNLRLYAREQEWVSEREDDLRGRRLTRARKTRHSRNIKSFLLQPFPPGFAVKFMREAACKMWLLSCCFLTSIDSLIGI